MLYQLLSGELPFDGHNFGELVVRSRLARRDVSPTSASRSTSRP